MSLFLLLLLTLFTSCSRKVTEHTEVHDSLNLTTNTSQTLSTKGFLTVSTTHFDTLTNQTDRTWSATTTRTYFSTPDTLGNQHVTLIEHCQSQGGSAATTTRSTLDTTLLSSHLNLRAIHADSTTLSASHHQTTYKQTTALPWYYRYPLYTLILLIILLLLHLLLTYLRSLTHSPS